MRFRAAIEMTKGTELNHVRTLLTKYYPCLVEQPSTSSADHPRSVTVQAY